MHSRGPFAGPYLGQVASRDGWALKIASIQIVTSETIFKKYEITG